MEIIQVTSAIQNTLNFFVSAILTCIFKNKYILTQFVQHNYEGDYPKGLSQGLICQTIRSAHDANTADDALGGLQM